MKDMRRGSRLLCIGIAACMMCGCGILPTEEEFDAAPLVKEYSDENVGKYTVTRGDMVQSESIAVRYEGTKKSDVYGTDDGIRIKKICVSKGQHVKKGDVLLQEYLEDEEESLKTGKRQVSTLTLQISQAKQMRQRELEQLNRTGGSKEEKENVKIVNTQNVSNKKIGWGIKRANNHEQPDLGSKNIKMLKENNGIAIGNKESKKIYLTSNTISDIQNDSNNLYKKLIELYPNEKIAFLTFDDGPNISVTPKVLDILKEENVKATFFITAHYVNTQPELVGKMIEEGHIIRKPHCKT